MREEPTLEELERFKQWYASQTVMQRPIRERPPEQVLEYAKSQPKSYMDRMREQKLGAGREPSPIEKKILTMLGVPVTLPMTVLLRTGQLTKDLPEFAERTAQYGRTKDASGIYDPQALEYTLLTGGGGGGRSAAGRTATSTERGLIRTVAPEAAELAIQRDMAVDLLSQYMKKPGVRKTVNPTVQEAIDEIIGEWTAAPAPRAPTKGEINAVKAFADELKRTGNITLKAGDELTDTVIRSMMKPQSVQRVEQQITGRMIEPIVKVPARTGVKQWDLLDTVAEKAKGETLPIERQPYSQIIADIEVYVKRHPDKDLWYHGGDFPEGKTLETGYFTKDIHDAIDYAKTSDRTGGRGEAFIYVVDRNKVKLGGDKENPHLLEPGKFERVFDINRYSAEIQGRSSETTLRAGDRLTNEAIRALAKRPQKWYSPLVRALESGRAGKIDIGNNPKASAVANILEKGGVSRQELEYSGMLDHLSKLGDQRVSRESLIAVAREGSKRLMQVGEPRVSGLYQETPELSRKMAEINTAIIKHNETLQAVDTEFSTIYRAAGLGEDTDAFPIIMDAATQNNITMMHKLKLDPIVEQKLFVLAQETLRLNNVRNKLSRQLSALSHGHSRLHPLKPTFGPTSSAGGYNLAGSIPDTYQERFFKYTPEGGLTRTDKHDWSAESTKENLMMFTRGHDRLLPNGEVTKHLDEAQSNWHSEGAEQGYAKPQTPTFDVKFEPGLGTFDWVVYRNGEVYNTFPAESQARHAVQEYVGGLWQMPEGVPDAPFKRDWHKLALRDWVDSAIKEGKESVTWSTGKLIAERYNKMCDKMEWKKDLDTGEYFVKFYSPSGRVVDRTLTNMREIEEFAGKNVGRIIREQEKIAEVATADIHGIVQKYKGGSETGEFLVGGQFYEKIYDHDLVKFAKQEYGVKPRLVDTNTKRTQGLEDKYSIVKATSAIENTTSISDQLRMFIKAAKVNYDNNVDTVNKLLNMKQHRHELGMRAPRVYVAPGAVELYNATTGEVIEGVVLNTGLRGIDGWINSFRRKAEYYERVRSDSISALTDDYVLIQRHNAFIRSVNNVPITAKSEAELQQKAEQLLGNKWYGVQKSDQIWHLPLPDSAIERITTEGQRISKLQPADIDALTRLASLYKETSSASATA